MCEPEDPCFPALSLCLAVWRLAEHRTSLGFSLTYSPEELNLPTPKVPGCS